MVNYCCVYRCGRNNKTNKDVHYYGLPKERHRLSRESQIEWLLAIGRDDLLDRALKHSHRVCSRHFSPSSVKNKRLKADAVPTLYLPNDISADVLADDIDDEPMEHENITCNSCSKLVQGFRYKCITCPNYDLCSRCEKYEVHADHCMLRIPKPMKFKKVEELTVKLQGLQNKSKHQRDDGSSDDDMPINEYIRKNECEVDLPEDVKAAIRNEVTRVLSINHGTDKVKKALKRTLDLKNVGVEKEQNKDPTMDQVTANASEGPELAFADVNDITNSQILDIKDEIPNLLVPLVEQPIINVKLSDEDLSQFMNDVKYRYVNGS